MIILLFIVVILFIIWYIVIDNKTQYDKAVLAYKQQYSQALDSNFNMHSVVSIVPPKVAGNYNSEQLAKIDKAAKWSCLGDYIKGLKVNDTLSPENALYVDKIAARLNLSIETNSEVAIYTSKLQEFWRWQNEDLKEIQVNISLHKNEVCYFQTRIQWYEDRTVTDSISYSGFSTSVRITKGVSYRVGSYKPYRQVHNELIQIDTGTLFVTNQRIIFMGAKKNSNIKYDNILSIVPHTDGVGIEKQSGKSPVLVCSDSQILAIVLSRLNK